MRRQARELGLQLLFQTEFNTELEPASILNRTLESLDTPHDAATVDYAKHIYMGVLSNKVEIDQRIQSASQHWKIDRMASVDRNLLRVATFEMFYSPDPIEPKIALNESIEIAKVYGTGESGGFVNGVLDQIVKNNRLRS